MALARGRGGGGRSSLHANNKSFVMVVSHNTSNQIRLTILKLADSSKTQSNKEEQLPFSVR